MCLFWEKKNPRFLKSFSFLINSQIHDSSGRPRGASLSGVSEQGGELDLIDLGTWLGSKEISPRTDWWSRFASRNSLIDRQTLIALLKHCVSTYFIEHNEQLEDDDIDLCVEAILDVIGQELKPSPQDHFTFSLDNFLGLPDILRDV